MVVASLSRCCLTGALLLLAVVPTAATPSVDAVRESLRVGAFLEAVELGEAEGSALGLALAAKASGYHARCILKGQPAEQRPFFQRTYDLARRAIELDPDEPEAWIQRARGYSRLLNYDKSSMSFDQTLKVIDRLDGYLNRAFALAGDRAEPAAARGRVEIGKLTASREIFLGVFSVIGNRDRAFRDFCVALDRLEAHPEDQNAALIYHTIAEGLWRLDPKRYAGLAAHYLDRGRASCEDNAVCDCIQREITQLRDEIDAAHPVGLPPAQEICTPR